VKPNNVIMLLNDPLRLDNNMYKKNVSDNQLIKVLSEVLIDIKDNHKLNSQSDIIRSILNQSEESKKNQKHKRDNKKK